MAKPLFKNYSFSFTKNETKLLSNFCKTLLKQMTADEKFYQDVRAFTAINEKLLSGEQEIKLTKEEKTKLTFRLKENMENMKKEMKKGFFIRRWIYKSAHKQYLEILETHFKD
ncbi:MAG: hypothetical protein FD143_943 [Ignavibacteria bacterium]|nr:MAG: hypothetical protein FD143_943 [Ignavibacteria bacterium]KAF0161186.1 MAG: hypothetical protein FD188_1097 [Ignavibacteria bacterium]